MCLHGELRVCHQKRNEVLDGQPGSIQGDKVPASKLGNMEETVPHQNSNSVKDALLNGEPM